MTTKTKSELDDDQEAIPVIAQRDSTCVACSKTVSAGDECFWVKGQGMFHPECVEGVSA